MRNRIATQSVMSYPIVCNLDRRHSPVQFQWFPRFPCSIVSWKMTLDLAVVRFEKTYRTPLKTAPGLVFLTLLCRQMWVVQIKIARISRLPAKNHNSVTNLKRTRSPNILINSWHACLYAESNEVLSLTKIKILTLILRMSVQLYDYTGHLPISQDRIQLWMTMQNC